MRHLAKAGGPKKLAYAKEKQLVYGMHKRNWSRETLVNGWRGKRVKVVVMGKVSGEDNGVVATVENPATTQEPVKRIGKRVVHRSNIVDFSFLGWLLYKVGILHSIGIEAFLAKSKAPFKTSCNTTISDPILETKGLFESELILQTLTHVLDVI